MGATEIPAAVRHYFQGMFGVVTGAASGIGFELARQMLEAGALVRVADWSADNLKAAAEKLAAFGERASFATVDVSRREQVEELVRQAARDQGRLDFLVNNAGIIDYGPVEEFTRERWERIVNINFWGVINGCYAALPIMLKQGYGHLINTASLGGMLPGPYQASYSTTKFAVLGFTECLCVEMRPKNIAVTAICPGDVVSNLVENSGLLTPGTKKVAVSDANFVDVPGGGRLATTRFACEEIMAGLAERRRVIITPREHVMKTYHLQEFLGAYCTDELQDLLQEYLQRRARNWEARGTVW